MRKPVQGVSDLKATETSRNFTWRKVDYYTFQIVKNKDTVHTVWMDRLFLHTQYGYHNLPWDRNFNLTHAIIM